MLSFIKKLFGFGTATPVAEAPYKVETPVIVLAPVVEVVESKPAAIKAKTAPAAKKPRAKKAPKA